MLKHKRKKGRCSDAKIKFRYKYIFSLFPTPVMVNQARNNFKAQRSLYADKIRTGLIFYNKLPILLKILF